MSEPTMAVAEREEPLTLPTALAERLTVYARERGMREDDAICEAVERLLRDSGDSRPDPDSPVPGMSAPPDWDVEIPLVVSVRPRSRVQIEAEVVRCERGVFPIVTDELLLEPDEGP